MFIGKFIAGIIIFSLLSGSLSFSATKSPEGFWKTIDDVTGKPKSIIKIWKNKDSHLTGRVVRIFPKHGEDQNKLCKACKGKKYNQPIVGMIILTGLTHNSKQWTNGKILDPENGKQYKCSARLSENGKQLNVRGFIGMSLFGRSQVWERIDLMSGA